MSSDNERQKMKTATIGFTRHDGDFQVLATLSNNCGAMTTGEFISLVNATRLNIELMAETADVRIEVKERADAADVVTLG